MKTCIVCGLGAKSKSWSKFCSDECRFAYNNALRSVNKRCKQCGLPALVREGDDLCVHCVWGEYVHRFRGEASRLVSWMRDNAVCFYCGETATDKEHVAPRRSGLAGLVVPACSECNSMAGGKLFSTVVEKAEYIRQARRKKFARIIKCPEWTDDEINELSGRLRGYVRASQLAKRIVGAQLEWNAAAAWMEATQGDAENISGAS